MAKVNKKEVVAALKASGIEFDPAAKVETLQGLLPAEHELAKATVTEDKAPKVDADRQARWDAHLAKAEKENPLFKMQKDNGEFDKIPDSFK